MEEMKEVHGHRIYDRVPLNECWDRTGKGPLKIRWVDVNKGDDVNPKYRSRLVARQL